MEFIRVVVLRSLFCSSQRGFMKGTGYGQQPVLGLMLALKIQPGHITSDQLPRSDLSPC